MIEHGIQRTLAQKLQSFVELEEGDLDALQALPYRRVVLEGRELLVSEGEPSQTFIVLLAGWACRFKQLPRGLRQITGFLLPGDFSPNGPHAEHVPVSSICSLTRCEIAEASWADVAAVIAQRPALASAFHNCALAEMAMLQEWLAGLGRRSAEQRMAHLFCELRVRLKKVGLGGETGYALPLTQATLGDALGLSPAHVNRTLQSLRTRGLLSAEQGRVQIGDLPRLQKFAGFSPAYLDALGDRPRAMMRC